MRTRIACSGLLTAVAFAWAATPLPAQWQGEVTVRGLIFPGAMPAGRQVRHETSLIFTARRYLDWDRGRQTVTIEPVVRLDLGDGRRSRVDFRDLSWQRVWHDWRLRVGLREVFWGVTESLNLVDVINQQDPIESGAGYAKLGQPMVNLTMMRNWGTIDFFLLPWFRERQFVGRAGRLWSPLRVYTDGAVFESKARQRHLDWTVRWTHAIGDWEIGLSHFAGTRRDPRFVSGTDEAGRNVLIPHYDLMDQTGLDVQWTTGGWLWKLEAMTRNSTNGRFAAVAGGFEYAFADFLSVYAEYVFDSRGAEATTSFENDLFAGARLTLQDGEIRTRAFLDPRTGNTVVSIEVVRRLSDNATLAAEVRVFEGNRSREPRYAPRQDGSIALTMSRYF